MSPKYTNYDCLFSDVFQKVTTARYLLNKLNQIELDLIQLVCCMELGQHYDPPAKTQQTSPSRCRDEFVGCKHSNNFRKLS